MSGLPSKYIDRAGDQYPDDREREQRFGHHERLGRPGERIRIGGTQRGCTGKGHEQIIEKMRRPPLAARLLREQEIRGLMAGVASLGASSIQFPVPQGEDQDVETPQQGARAQ